MQDEIAALREAMLSEKHAVFERHREHLKKQLREEILSRYFGPSARIAASLDHDEHILAAVRLLEDTPAYTRILAPR